eukprot:scaffold6784_cov108-Cylindrotheca_fusiformis.AAC.11
MTIRTPFYFVICAEGRDVSAPQPVVDAADYYSAYEDDDDDSSCSSVLTDISDDFMTFDDDDCDMDLNIALPTRLCDIPTLENHLRVVPGFQEWEDGIKFDASRDDPNSVTLTEQQVNPIKLISNASHSFAPTETRTNRQ